MTLDSAGSLLKEYKVYVKYLILFSLAYLVKCVFEYLYNRSSILNNVADSSAPNVIESGDKADSPLFDNSDKTVVEESQGDYFYNKYLTDTESEKNIHIPFSLPRFEVDEMKTRARQFYEVVNTRRSCRFFSPDPVPRDVLEHCILAAGTSPSGAHTEPWQFVVVYNKEDREIIREIVEDEEKVNYERRMGKKWLQDLAKIKTTFVKEYISEADCIILVFKEPFHYKDNVKHNNWYYEASVSISVGILLCALNNVGLVTVTSTPMNCGPAIRRLLGRPDHEKLAFLLPVGYPATSATVPALKRKTIDQISLMSSDEESKLISQLTKEYGRVHTISTRQLKEELSNFGLDTRGTVLVLQKRLKEHYRRVQSSVHPQIAIWHRKNPHSHYAIIDFEATCDENLPETDFMHEIIEVPVVLVSAATAEIIDIFHEYVKPKMCPVLSPFCKKLTGINQTVINQSRSFVEVWKDLETWIEEKRNLSETGINSENEVIKSLCFVTDGPWDFKKFLAKESRYNNMDFPSMCVQFCNLRRRFCNFYGVKRVNIQGMLKNLGQEFDGTPHSGISDSRNIANIVCTMVRDGAVLDNNEVVDINSIYTA
ncbi:uncharacterized protein LOC134825581 [Bolinopsis microptera]|uniref:uncharacterized protein LOC134825581 n=1 Tax=Bolinopsis microptera TaxID=2820187 RepID=UPI00307A62DB